MEWLHASRWEAEQANDHRCSPANARVATRLGKVECSQRRLRASRPSGAGSHVIRRERDEMANSGVYVTVHGKIRE